MNNKDMVHWVINAAGAVLFTCGGFIINMAFTNIDKVEMKVDDIPIKYVLKEDYRVDQQNIMAELKNISQKLTHNAEYMEADYNRRMDKIEKLLTDKP